MNIYTAIDLLVGFAKNNLMLDEFDGIYARNRILAAINLDEYKSGNVSEEDIDKIKTAKNVLDELLDASVMSKLISAADKEKTAHRIMRALTLSPSEIADIYRESKSKNDSWLDLYISLSMLNTKAEGDAFAPVRTENGVEFLPTGIAAEEKFMPVYTAINNLIIYAENNLLLDEMDKAYAIQDVLDILGVKSYAETDIDNGVVELERPDAVLQALSSAILESGLVTEDELEKTIDMIMGTVSLIPGQVGNLFEGLCAKNSKKAMDWLYDYSIKNNYIKRTLLDTNIRFKAGYTKGRLEITINKAKPEYTDAKKAASGNAVKGGYPKCTICRENEGFAPLDRCTLRLVDIKLGGESFFWQFSPYGYFYKHGIAVNEQHVPMSVNGDTVVKLMDFVDKFPSMFVGCNAALLGIGGSVLAHDHFQSGEESLPMQKAVSALQLSFPKYPLAEVGVLDWYNSVIRVTSQSRQVIKDICEEIINGWEAYSNKEQGIVAKDKDGQHNSVSQVVRKIDNGRYCVDITLRNNYATNEFPLGVFHAHPEFHAIKKESIGLIESQGLFVLPGRLEQQIEVLNECLVEKKKLPADMAEFSYIYNEIVKENGKEYTKVEANIAIKAQLGSVCERILINTAVFKTKDETASFLESLGSFERKTVAVKN